MRIPLESIINKTFNNILVLGEGERVGKKQELGLKVKCLLCLKEYNMAKYHLKNCTSCGCHLKINNAKKEIHHLENRRFGNLLVIEKIDKEILSKQQHYKCLCDCRQ